MRFSFKAALLKWIVPLPVVAVLPLIVLGLRSKPDIWEGVDQSQVYLDRHGKLLRLTLANDGNYRLKVFRDHISPLLVEATLLHEDRYFYSHPGVNPWALAKALLNELSGNPNRFGASTVTMQLARIRFDLNTKNVSGKIRQSLRALQLEWYYSKEEILEAYLNQASYGRNIVGIEAASLIYYGKSAQDLNLAEALTLAVIPQSPLRRSPRHSGENTRGNIDLIAARAKLFARWLKIHPLDKVHEPALALALQVKTPRDLPFLAPHFIEWQKARKQSGKSSLDFALQKVCEIQISAFVEKRKELGIRNAAALLVDTRNMEVRAAVGSADFFDKDIDGQVNGITMRRSPGSTLKPLLYALAMDEGLIHPHSLLKDAPLSLAGYNPENYDRDFAGPISAEAALQQSRNVPAVWLCSQLKQKSLYGLLQDSGVQGLKEQSHYGLTLALGSAEMSMADLAQLYGMLANGGSFEKLKTLESDEDATPRQLLSKEACFLTLDMLKQVTGPGRARSEGLRQSQGSVAWKTGTSWSFRDAWSVAVFDQYVLVVWVGNFDGQGNAALVGRQTAAPLLFTMIDSIRARVPSSGPAVWEKRDALNLSLVDICAVSGGLVSPCCEKTMKAYFIPGVSPIKTCTVHQPILVDIKSGLRTRKKKEGVTRTEIYEVWPSDILELFKKAGLPRRAIPAFEEEGTVLANSGETETPSILSPQGGVVYSVSAFAEKEKRQIAMKASGSGMLHWFANTRMLGETKPGEVLLWEPGPGSYILTVVSASGLSDSRNIEVESME